MQPLNPVTFLNHQHLPFQENVLAAVADTCSCSQVLCCGESVSQVSGTDAAINFIGFCRLKVFWSPLTFCCSAPRLTILTLFSIGSVLLALSSEHNVNTFTVYCCCGNSVMHVETKVYTSCLRFWWFSVTKLTSAAFTMTYQFTNFILTVWCRSGCGTDHSGGLIVRQLFDAALSCHYVTHLKWTNMKQKQIEESGIWILFKKPFSSGGRQCSPLEVGRCASAPVPPVDTGGGGISGWACICLWSTVLLCIQ